MDKVLDDLKIKHIKLLSGDELLGLVAGIDPKTGVIFIERPVQIEISDDQVTMREYMPLSDDKIIAFASAHVIAQSTVIDTVKERYVRFCIGSSNHDSNADASDTDHDDFDIEIPEPVNKLLH